MLLVKFNTVDDTLVLEDVQTKLLEKKFKDLMVPSPDEQIFSADYPLYTQEGTEDPELLRKVCSTWAIETYI